MCTAVNAQQDHTLFFMHNLPESNLVNPAVPIKCKVYIGIPGLSSVHANYNNNSFTVSEMFYPQRVNDSLLINPENIVSKIRKNAFASDEVHATLFTAGYRWNDFYLNFSVSEKQNFYTMAPGDMVRLAWDGNTQFRGQQMNLTGLRVSGSHYREYALGGSKQINEALRIGLKTKLLFGKGNVSTAVLLDCSWVLVPSQRTFRDAVRGDHCYWEKACTCE